MDPGGSRIVLAVVDSRDLKALGVNLAHGAPGHICDHGSEQ